MDTEYQVKTVDGRRCLVTADKLYMIPAGGSDAQGAAGPRLGANDGGAGDAGATGGGAEGDAGVAITDSDEYKALLAERDSAARELEAYRKYGKPEELEGALARLREYDQVLEEYEKEANLTIEQRKLRDAALERRQAFNALMEETYPGFADLLQQMAAAKEQTEQAHVARSTELLEELAAAKGFDTKNEKLMNSLSSFVEAVILDNETLTERFWNPATTRTAISEALNQVTDSLVNPLLMEAGAKTLEQLAQARAKHLSSVGASGNEHRTGEEEFKPSAEALKNPALRAAEREAWRNATLDRLLDEAEAL